MSEKPKGKLRATDYGDTEHLQMIFMCSDTSMFLFSGKRRIIMPAIRRKHDKEFTVISNKAILDNDLPKEALNKSWMKLNTLKSRK